MNNEKDIILKYLADLLDEGEKIEFEKRLEESPELAKRMEELKSSLDGLKQISQTAGDSKYFVNLLPRIRERIEEKKTSYNVIEWKNVLAMMVVALIVAVVLFRQNGEYSFINYENLKYSISSIISEEGQSELNDYMEARYITYLDSRDVFNFDLDAEEFVNLSSSDIDDSFLNYRSSDIIENGIENYITDEEAESIYKEILNKKILQE
ncbi:hypothetical protein ACFLS9_02880 [Bacteroidota bacterium]